MKDQKIKMIAKLEENQANAPSLIILPDIAATLNTCFILKQNQVESEPKGDALNATLLQSKNPKEPHPTAREFEDKNKELQKKIAG